MTVQGLTFNDVIYSQKGNETLTLNIGSDYRSEITDMQLRKLGFSHDINILKYIENNFMTYEQLENTSHKNYFVEEYTDGSICEVNK